MDVEVHQTAVRQIVRAATGILQMISPSFQEKMVQEQEEHSSNLFGIEEKKDGEKVDMTTDDAQITNSTSVMLTTVAGDDYAIGYVSLGSLNDTVKL